MLSIVKMDLDSDHLLVEALIKSEEVDIVEEPIVKNNWINSVSHPLELTPIVYTTRLDEMNVLKSLSYLAKIHPREVTNRILMESKPVLRTTTINPAKKRANKKKFKEMKKIIEDIFHPPIMTSNNDESDTITDELNIQIDLSSVKSEVQEEPCFENTETKDKCKYSELLKLCKPCSVMIGRPCDKALHGGQVLPANKVQKSRLSQGQSTDDEELLITFPNLLVDRSLCKIPEKMVSKENKRKNSSAEIERTPKRSQNATPVNTFTGVRVEDLSHVTQRIMRNGLLEIHDIFSKERHIYHTDSESNLLDYFKVADDSEDIRLYKTTNFKVEYNYIAENCCWVKRDEALKSLYPKVLLYPNSRFVRRPHPCKPGACICCCRRKENIKKPNLIFTGNKGLPLTSANRMATNAEEDIIDLEDEIDKSIININRTPKLDSNEWLRDLLTKRSTDNNHKINTLIAKALSYKKPQPKKIAENRRLVTFQKEGSQNTVIILRNFAMDVTEIYAINTDGDIETYIKTTCYNNTSQPDVRKLLKKPNAINESVCCWFKREEVIAKLHNTKELHPSAVKFIRTNHTCPSTECTCCCKPIIKKEATLTDINFPLRKSWTKALMSFRPSYEPEFQQREQPRLAPPKTVKPNHNGPPLVSIPPAKPSTFQNEDDCEITSMTTIPTFQTPLQHPTVPEAIPTPVLMPSQIPLTPQGLIVTDVVNSDELSQEVNSLISSILDRFKDVRLTINNDGKVAAALNTPVNTLSTVELKVLANILSYAQNQVNLLGLKGSSGMSLSNIINLKVDDQANSNLDPHTVYKAFGKNVNLGSNAQNRSNNTPNVFSQAPILASVPQTYAYFTNSMTVRNQNLNDAFSSYLTSKIDDSAAKDFNPVIENVFTLKEEADPEPSSTTVWYSKPAAQQTTVSNSYENNINTNSDSDTSNDNKRKDIETQPSQFKKLRVLSPTKLGVTTSNPGGIATTPLENMSGVGFDHIQIPSLANPQMQTIGALPTPSSQPMLIINPLNTPGLMVRSGGTVSVSVPFTNNLISTSNELNTTNTPMPIIANVSTEQGVNPLQTSMATPEVLVTGDNPQEEVDEDYSVDNEGEVDYNADDDAEMDREAEIDYSVDNETEEKYSPDDEEEADCILGF